MRGCVSVVTHITSTTHTHTHSHTHRSYITFDILRRVISDYFKYDVLYAMNITDVDDKIIRRARRNFLLEQYAAKPLPPATLLADLTEALEVSLEGGCGPLLSDMCLQAFKVKVQSESDLDKKSMLTKTLVSCEDNHLCVRV